MSTQKQRDAMAKARAARRASPERNEADVTARNFPQARPMTERARVPRMEAMQGERRRRKAGTLNRMAQFKLDIFDPEQLDPDYIYRWITDDGSRLRMCTRQDDYEFVQSSEIKGFNPDAFDSESSERVRMIMGRDKNGGVEYGYLCKKRKDFFEADLAASMDMRQAMMEGRVYSGELNDPGESAEHTYVPTTENVTLGNASRRRGPIEASK